jgi:diguanylate cyclase (GGDEF)-like protein
MGNEETGLTPHRVRTATLETAELFRGENPDCLEWVLHRSAVRCVAPGEVLLAPDRHNDALYVILTGRAEVRFSRDDPRARMDLEPGECVGELSIIEGTQPSATVVASRRSQVLVIKADVVWALIDRSPVVARNLLHILSMRVRRNTLALVQSHLQQRIHERDALNDPLTGLHNRRWMERSLVRIVERCARARQPLALLMIDVDYFKRYNDVHGHPAGDRLLTMIARLVSETLRATDHACRYGGDEFLVILPQAVGEEAAGTAERLCRSVAERSGRPDHGLRAAASVSIGVAVLTAGMTFRELLAAADAALYRAKAAGRGRMSR